MSEDEDRTTMFASARDVFERLLGKPGGHVTAEQALKAAFGTHGYVIDLAAWDYLPAHSDERERIRVTVEATRVDHGAWV
jgi:hypothetical protein